ncbi:MAG: GNAT family N-acetyltransferase [Pseudobutyrivibrio sp.]|nr:GNAT family N-acetyltransferase [Pseudobutyrivibrio sp.]
MKFEVNTPNLTLKVLDKNSADLVLDFYNRNGKVFEKYEPLLGENFYTLAHQRKLLEFEQQNILKLFMIRYWIFEKDNPNRIIGTLSYRNIVRPIYESCIIGYKMDQEFTNRGYCSEAIKHTIPIITSEYGIHRIEALIMPDNAPSIHMVEKLGFKYEGLLHDKIVINGERLDHCMYAYLADN